MVRDPEGTLESIASTLEKAWAWVRAIEHETACDRAIPFLGDALVRLEEAQDMVTAARNAMIEDREKGK